MIHYYYGYGQGKTSTATGLAMRALGNGLSVLFLQFLKAAPSGEVSAMERVGITLRRSQKSQKFVSAMTAEERTEEARRALRMLRNGYDEFSHGLYDVLILDEVTDAVLLGLIPEETLKQLLINAPSSCEVILTGHEPLPWLVDLAEYVTEYTSIHHPYEKGISARKGYEY